MFEYNARRVLTETKADARQPPASLTKLMTAEVVFDELKRGALSMDDSFKVSEYAWRTSGAVADSSTMFLPVGSTATVSDLLQGLIV